MCGYMYMYTQEDILNNPITQDVFVCIYIYIHTHTPTHTH